MDKLINLITEFNSVSLTIRLVLAVVLGGLIGSERGRHGRVAGLRTHILICVGAALTALTGLFAIKLTGNTGDIFRISAQVISGIGFLGVGTIMVRNNSSVTGLTTAAGLWATAAIGIAVGYGFYTGSIIATFICIFTTTVLSKLQREQKNVIHLYLEVDDIKKTGDIIDEIRRVVGRHGTVEVIPPKSNTNGHIGVLADLPHSDSAEDNVSALRLLEGICFIIEENS